MDYAYLPWSPSANRRISGDFITVLPMCLSRCSLWNLLSMTQVDHRLQKTIAMRISSFQYRRNLCFIIISPDRVGESFVSLRASFGKTDAVDQPRDFFGDYSLLVSCKVDSTWIRSMHPMFGSSAGPEISTLAGKCRSNTCIRQTSWDLNYHNVTARGPNMFSGYVPFNLISYHHCPRDFDSIWWQAKAFEKSYWLMP